MFALGFEVHVDKENAQVTSVSSKEVTLKNIGQQNTRGVQGKSQRKALSSVNYDVASGAKKLTASKDGAPVSLRPSNKISSDVENFPTCVNAKKHDSRKTSKLQHEGLKVLPGPGQQPCSRKLTVKWKQPKTAPEPQLTAEVVDEDYDSDVIFPKSERLSSYVSKLLTWRPPCLFGALPESESDNSDIEELPQDDIVLDLPLSLPTALELSGADLTSLIDDLPPPQPVSGDFEDTVACHERDTEQSLDQTNDISFTFGSLQVMHGSLDVSRTDSVNSSISCAPDSSL